MSFFKFINVLSTIVGNHWVCFKEALRGKRNTLAAFFSDSEKWQPHESAMTGWLGIIHILRKNISDNFCLLSPLRTHSSLVDYLAQVIYAKNCPITFYWIFQLVWVPS